MPHLCGASQAAPLAADLLHTAFRPNVLAKEELLRYHALRMDLLYILRAAFEILVLWVIFYQLYRAFKDSRAAAILAGLVITLLLAVFLLEILHASVLQRIASAIIGPGTILVILFQTEIRTALAKLGTHPFLGRMFLRRDRVDNFPSRVCDSVSYLVSKRFGALIAICRRDKLPEIVSSGTKLDAIYSRELIGSIFMAGNKTGSKEGTLLHDGAVIVDNERIVAARCVLPVSNRELKDTSMGLRHRAGLGLAESSDAVVIIVSEETGTLSLAVGNVLQSNLTLDLLRTRLTDILYASPAETKDEDDDTDSQE